MFVQGYFEENTHRISVKSWFNDSQLLKELYASNRNRLMAIEYAYAEGDAVVEEVEEFRNVYDTAIRYISYYKLGQITQEELLRMLLKMNVIKGFII